MSSASSETSSASERAKAGSGSFSEAGFTSVQSVAVMAMSLLALLALANFVVFQYGRGAVRAALDEAVRVGSRASASVAECEARAEDVLDDLLGGAMGAGVSVTCQDTGQLIEARATATFSGWIPPVPDWTFTVAAAAVHERAP